MKVKGKNGRYRKTHGMSYHRLYGVWSKMMDRCYNSNIKAYKWYGARGIKICDRWLDPRVFIEDMYPSFKEGLTLDRIDNDKGYSKENCRWATFYVQAINRRYKGSNIGIVGVHKRENNTYRAYIQREGIIYHLGSYETIEEALNVRQYAESLTYEKLSSLRRGKTKGKVLQKIGDRIIKIYQSQAHAVKSTGFRQNNISACLRGIRKTASGYSWEYE